MDQDKRDILVLGDPYVSASKLAAPVAELLGDRYRIIEYDWTMSFEELVKANLRIEQMGADAVTVPGEYGEDPERIVAVLTQFFPLSASTLQRWPNLRIAATLRAGVENIDTAELERRGVQLVNNAGRNANAVAEFAVGMILARLRGIGAGHHCMREGGWRPEPPSAGYQELSGKVVGIVGLGSVGSIVAHRLSGFDVELLGFDPYVGSSSAPNVELTSLESLLRRSDVVTVHARLVPATRNLIGADQLALMRPDAIIVNTGRAELIDEAELVARLADGRIAGAALDVFTEEPLPADHPLRHIESVLLSPHLAGTTVQAVSRGPQLIAERLHAAIESLRAGEPTILKGDVA
jgi:D-3-phosphoglycerate dehydrogenase